MSDIVEKPWEMISDSRRHRCAPPPRARLGRRYECECGTIYMRRRTAFGLQWLPITNDLDE